MQPPLSEDWMRRGLDPVYKEGRCLGFRWCTGVNHMQFIAGTAVHNQAQHYTAASGGGTLVNSRPCAQRYARKGNYRMSTKPLRVTTLVSACFLFLALSIASLN